MATHFIPSKASQSPSRPVSSYSMASTIRRVTPSPESLSEALSKGYATQSTPRPDNHTQPTKDFRLASVDGKTLLPGGYRPENDNVDDISRAHSLNAPSDRPHFSGRRRTSRIPVPAYHISSRSSTAGAIKRRKTGRISPSKLGAPRKHRSLFPSKSRTASRESETQTISAAKGSHVAAAGLATAMARPLSPPDMPDDEKARLAEFTLFPTEDPFARAPPSPPQSINPTRPAVRHQENYFQDETDLHHDLATMNPPLASPYKPLPLSWTKRTQQIEPDMTSPSRPQKTTTTPVKPPLPRQTSTRSVASATFSTPGRDEMERKRGHADEGPFRAARGVQELAERRRQVSERKSVVQRFEASEKRSKMKEKGGLCRCVVM